MLLEEKDVENINTSSVWDATWDSSKGGRQGGR